MSRSLQIDPSRPTSLPPRDVKAVVEAYLEEAHKLGFKALRIIHGRGIGVQREIVRVVLNAGSQRQPSYPLARPRERNA
jgi:dsDNA-specific endonuclease/ATPase MutS2